MAIVVSSFGVAGCTKGAGIAGGGAYSNVSGTVAQSVSGLGVFGKVAQKLGVQTGIKSLAVEPDCDISALDISNPLATALTATSDTNGHYTVAGVAAGKTYKIIADCGANKYSSVATASVTDPAGLEDTERVGTNPRSTLIAAYVLQAVTDSVDTSIQGVVDPLIVADIKEDIYANLDGVIQPIESTISEAIEAGSMEEPDPTAALAVTNLLETAADANDITNAIAAGAIDAPVAVTQAVTGATQNSAAIKACDAAKGGTLAECTRIVAKLMYNVLGFPVAIKTDAVTGVFGLSGCSSADTINGTAETVEDAFPNSTVVEGDAGVTNDYPDTLCVITPLLGRPDRNRGYEKMEDHSGPMFSETADMDNDAINDIGVISAMGTALFNKYNYRLSHLNRIVFDYVSGAGMNARIVNQRFVVNAGGGAGENAHYYYNGTSWVNTLWPATCGFGNDEVCRWWDLNFGFTNGTWASAANNIPLATVIGTSQVALNVMGKKFSGPVPTQVELDTFIDQGRVHAGHNISGEKEYNVVTTKPAGFGNAGVNPCWDKDPSTPCLDPAGTAVVPVRVDLTFGAADGLGIKPITTITAAVAGAYYIYPMWGMNGFTGVLGFIKKADGKIAQDELMNQRAVKVILYAGECGANGLTDGGCGQGDIYNVSLDWSQCGSGGACPGFTENGGDVAITGYAANVQSDYRTSWEQFCGVSGCIGHQLVGSGDFGSMEPFKFTVASQANSDILTLTGTGKASAGGEYNIAIKSDCTIAGCTFAGFYFVDNAGDMHVDADVNCGGCSSPDFWGGTDVGVYSLAYVNTGNDFDGVTGGAQTLQTVAANYWIFNAPIPNPNFQCEGEPYFVDGNGNGTLDCGTVLNVSTAINGDISFSGSWEYSWYISDPSLDAPTAAARALKPMRERENAFAFANPIGTKKLMSTAFNGWFDGTHTISSTTDFNALQVFALVYLFFEEGNEYKNIDGIISGQTRFSVESPIFENEDLLNMNKSIGQGLIDFRVTP
jgi:hypothetical protein